MRPGGEVVMPPLDVVHNAAELTKLAKDLLRIDGEVRVVMEYTGAYYLPIAYALCDAGLSVSVVHAKLVHDFGNNSIRRGKTDRKDAVKIANYGLANWNDLPQFMPTDVIRQQLRTYNRQQSQYAKIRTMLKNSLIALLDQTFPGLNDLFSDYPRKSGHEKWIDFALMYWHRDCVADLSLAKFSESYRKWCKRTGSQYSAAKAESVHTFAREAVSVLPKNGVTKRLLTTACEQLNHILEAVNSIQTEMDKLSAQLPEYATVMAMTGTGKVLGPQLMAEIGDVTRFHGKHALTAFAGLDSPPFQSGTFESKERKISKRGSPHLRATLYNIATVLIQNKPEDDEVYRFLDRKRAEGKHYYVYMTAASNKFLRVYYGKVSAYLRELSQVAVDSEKICGTEITAVS
jgi:transposase